ncbi:MAG: DNA polymerase III subunit alpha [Sedimentisphaeraceae bacterium JB056]
MAQNGFSHLHLHTQFSLLDGAVVPGKLFGRCKELGMDSVAITDHGNMYGALDFYRGAISAGVKPIIGMEAYFTPGNRTDRTGTMKDGAYHLILLAENNQGYKNLLKLSSRAYMEGFYYRPRIDMELLEQYSEGLIATSACIGGIIPQMYMAGREQEAREAAERYVKIFGEKNFFIELQDHNYVDAPPVDPNPMMIDLARKMGLGMVVTNDVHFLNENDYEAHDVLTCISTGKIYTDPNRMKYPTDVYLKSPEQMRQIFPDLQEACDLTVEIANRCNVEIDLKTRHAPSFTPPDGSDPGQFLRKLVYEGAERLYPEITDEVRERIEREIGVIDGKGFSSYFLIVWEFCNWAAENSIPTGARGSGVGTIVGYCLGLCNVDPIKYGLLFERFMDPERDEMPDIDIDICQDGRPRLLEYVREKYGEIAQIITFGTMKPKSVIRDVSRVLDVPLNEADKLAKMVPDGPKVKLEKVLEEIPEFKEEYENNPTAHKVIDIGKRLEGLTRHSGVHACAVVIADEPLSNFLPICRQASSEDAITQFEGPSVEAVGLLKMDFLGLRTLSVIEKTKQWVKQLHDVDIDIEKIDITDMQVFNIFASGRTKGVFQFESGGMVDMLMKLKPDRLEDLIAANALYRPGPMALIPDFIARKHGADWEAPHPIMREILEETFGIMIYQEQVMQICHRLGGIKLRAAYSLIKAIGKKKEKVINAALDQFVKGCVEKGLTAEQGNDIFELIKKFAGYGFNKSHASRYSYVAYQTAYLKAYWPAEFMAALLTYEKGDTAKVVDYIGEAKDMGIDILPPDVNESYTDFTVIYDDEQKRKDKIGHIRFGLGAVKGVGIKAVQQIIEARNESGPFNSLYHFCETVDLRAVNKQVIESLIKAGAFDKLSGTRSQMVEGLENAVKAGQQVQRDRNRGQKSLFGAMEQAGDSQDNQDSARLPDVPAWPEMTMLKYEKDVLGLYVTSNPLSKHADTITAYSTAHTDELAILGGGKEVIIGGMITKIRSIITKKGRNAGAKMAVLELEDFNGKTEVVLFPSTYANNAHLVESDKVVFVRGKIDSQREQPQIICDEIIDISLAGEKLTTKVKMNLNAENVTDQIIEQLQDLCQAYSGKSPVYLMISTDDGQKVSAISDNCFFVQPDADFRVKVREILGEENLELSR